MGRAILVLLGAAALSAMYMNQAGLSSSQAQDEVIADFEFGLLSRQIAMSAMNIGVAEAKQDFLNAHNIYYRQTPFQDGAFDLTGSTVVSGEQIGLHAVGMTGGEQYHICSIVSEGGGGPIESALIIDTDDADADFRGNSFLITGNDTAPPSEPTAPTRRPVHAIGVPSVAIENVFESEIASNQEDNVTGMDGDLDVYPGPTVFDIDAFYAEALTQVDTTFGTGTFNGNDTYGSKTHPTVVRIAGDARIMGDWSGFGVLLIEGDFELGAGNFVWEGIVMVRPPDGEDLDIRLSGGAEIYGALIVQTGAPGPSGMPTELTFDHRGTASVAYSANTIDRLGATFSTITGISPVKLYISSYRESSSGC